MWQKDNEEGERNSKNKSSAYMESDWAVIFCFFMYVYNNFFDMYLNSG